jgi:hypothetical protein
MEYKNVLHHAIKNFKLKLINNETSCLCMRIFSSVGLWA